MINLEAKNEKEQQRRYQISFSENNDVLTAADVQKILGISQHRVYFHIQNKKLFAAKPGNSFMIPKPALNLYIDEKRNPKWIDTGFKERSEKKKTQAFLQKEFLGN